MRVAHRSVVTVAFGPPENPFKARAAIHHAVHWNKLREMLRPFGYEEIEGSAQILGGGDGSVISFRTSGPPVLPQPVQDWLREVEPKGFEVASAIAKGAAKVLAALAAVFGVPVLGQVAAGTTVFVDVLERVFGKPAEKPPGA